MKTTISGKEEEVKQLFWERNFIFTLAAAREKFQVESKSFDPSSKRTTLHQQLHQARKDIQKLKEENMQLGLEVRYVIRWMRISFKIPFQNRTEASGGLF